MSEIYEPREDSQLIRKHIKRYAKGNVLDMGTGSGILAVEASKKADKVLGLDINIEAIKYCRRMHNSLKNVSFRQSDLFSKLSKKDKFDLITFNPPYLPEDKDDIKDIALYGGKHGHETIGKFLADVNDHLKDDGKTLLLFSSFTDKEKVDEIVRENLLKAKQVDKEHIFFEDLFVYLLEKESLLKKLNELGVSDLKYLTKGHRGILFTGRWKGKKVTIKAKLPESKAISRIENEWKNLEVLNKKGIGPNVIYKEKDFFMYDYVEGEFILKFMKEASKKDIIVVLKEILRQLYIMDQLKTDKEEMHHPFKHILVKGKNVVMLDFERCNKTERPKNITQFLMFLRMKSMNDLLKEKGINLDRELLIRTARDYKKSYDLKIIDFII